MIKQRSPSAGAVEEPSDARSASYAAVTAASTGGSGRNAEDAAMRSASWIDTSRGKLSDSAAVAAWAYPATASATTQAMLSGAPCA